MSYQPEEKEEETWEEITKEIIERNKELEKQQEEIDALIISANSDAYSMYWE